MVWANEAGTAYYNHQWREFTGIDDVSQIDRLALIHPGDRATALRAWEDAQRTGHYEAEYRLQHRSGEFRWIISRGTPIRDERKQIAAWYGTCTDIHDRKIARDALTASEALNRSIIEASPDPILLLDVEGRITFMSSAARRELPAGLLAETLGSMWLEAFGEFPEAERVLKSAVGGVASRITVEHTFAECPTKSWDIALTPVSDDDSVVTAVLVVARNISDARRAEEQIQDLQMQVVQASQLIAMGNMAATLAHELNQPLTAATNYLRGVDRIMSGFHSTVTAEAQFGLEQGRRAVDRAAEIIRGVRRTFEQKPHAQARHSLRRLVQNVVRMLGTSLAATIHTSIDDLAVWVNVNDGQIEQVLLNLIRNASDALHDHPTPVISVSASLADNLVRVCVSDNGPGIEAPRRATLFSPIESSKADGLGIGLSICRTIVEQYGGRIWLDEAVAGTSICFTVAASLPETSLATF